MKLITEKYPSAQVSHPSGLQTKIRFEDGLVVNVFTNGTVNFQGNSFKNPKESDINNLIEFINR